MLNKRLATFLTALSLQLAAAAQSPTQVVILPLEGTGNYAAMDDDRLSQTLQARLHTLAPGADIQVARSAELTAYQYKMDTDQPPALSTAEAISRAYSSKHVCWISIHFHPNYDADTGTLALAGAARVWLYDRDMRRVEFDSPLSLVRTAAVKDIKDAEASQKVAVQLAEGCLSDLASQLVGLAENKLDKARQHADRWDDKAPAAPTFQPGPHYNQMLHAIHDYQKAANDHNYMDVSSSEQNMINLWMQLSKDEQDHIAKAYPGIAQLMTARPHWGGYYWPHYYGRRQPFGY